MIVWWLAAALAGDSLRFEVVGTVTHGEETPVFRLLPATSGEAAARVTCAGRTWSVKQAVVAGKPVDLKLAGIAEGSHVCDALIEFRAADGSDGEMTLQFPVHSLPLLSLTSSYEAYDPVGSKLVVTASRAVAEATAEVLGVGGAVVARARVDLTDPTRPTLSWDARGQEVVRIDVSARDEAGFVGQLELSPWFYQVPHEDVVFSSNSAEIPAGEVGKLDRTWADVQAVLAKYGAVVPVKLYVAGYTDTVGDAAANTGLSERRARAIAGWFRARGFAGEVWYQGFGEEVLAVPTPDGTDLEANRRAVYLLGAQAPPRSVDLPRAGWKRL